MKSAISILVFAAASAQLSGQSIPVPSERNRLLFTTQTFGGNGRTCDTCHSLTAGTGTVSPQDARRRYQQNPLDPLFLFDGSDDGQGHGVTRMLKDATILITLPLPPNVALADDPTVRTVTLRRGIPTTRNTPALDPVLMLDGREPNLPTQALHARQAHDQPTVIPTLADLLGISQFELTERFSTPRRCEPMRKEDPRQRCRKGRRIPKNAGASSSSMRRLRREARRAVAPSATAARC
jgi:hypothetical protein